jgi:PadR family transcriptional regulator, regulatory protein PadR
MLQSPWPDTIPADRANRTGRFFTYLALQCIMLLCNDRRVHWRRTTRVIVEINKDLIAASSTPIVLAILAEGDSYGYAILQRVREVSGGRIEWTDGMLYPVLHRLERLGHVKARWQVADSGRRRKYYRITSQGRAQLAEERRQWQTVDATLRGIWRDLRVAIPISRPALAAPFP